MSSTRRKYTEEFKSEAIELSEKIGVVKASKDLGIHVANIGRWKSKKLNGRVVRKGEKSYEELLGEYIALKKENEYLTKVSDILKKSLGIVSRDPLRGTP